MNNCGSSLLHKRPFIAESLKSTVVQGVSSPDVTGFLLGGGEGVLKSCVTKN